MEISQVFTVVKSPPANAGGIGGVGIGGSRDTRSIPGSGRSPRVGSGNLLQYSCLENSINSEAWQAPVHRVTKSQT